MNLKNTRQIGRWGRRIAEKAETWAHGALPGQFLAGVCGAFTNAVIITDLDGRVRYWNPAAEELYGYPAPQALGCFVGDLVVPPSGRARAAERAAALADVPNAGDWEVQDRSGRIFTDIAGIVCTGRDVTVRVEAQEELRRRALRDELTGLANRTLLSDRIDQALARAARTGNSPVAVIVADLDQFKLINDSWRHAAGDRLLAQVARRLTDAARDADTVARFGGDEFVVVCEDTDQPSAQGVAERLQEALADPFDLDGRRAYVRASIGIAVSPPHFGPDLLRFTDAAMYAAKSGGRGRVQLFDVTLAEDAADRLTLGNDLRDALARDELVLHFQPVVQLATGLLVGLEALARWSHPDRGPVSPQRFVEVAETGGFVSTLNRWALRRARRDAGQLRSLLPALPRIAVNISVRHLVDADLEADVLSAVSGDELGPHELVLEITESALMDNADETRKLLERLRARGIKTAIDDFGTGYSSLAHLNRLPVATLKIDRSFIRNITVDADSLAITASIIELARSMGLATIAEGVETIEQLTLLQNLGCWAAQGFSCARSAMAGRRTAPGTRRRIGPGERNRRRRRPARR
jgi:diguanylate cyclase (GGDEF)-like protein/PAS domain S-box-containing protein